MLIEKKFIGAALAIGALALAGCQTNLAELPEPSSTPRTLTGDEIRAYAGRTSTWESKDGSAQGRVTLNADGTQTLTSNIPGVARDTGTWRVSGNRQCATWTRIRDGEERCSTWTLMPDGSIDTGNTITRF
ncbi:MAG: hypothetical protein ACXIVD_08650 [Salinarimonas sp.]